MRDDTRVPPLPTRGTEREAIISEGIIGRRKQKITGLRLVLFGAAHERKKDRMRRATRSGGGGGGEENGRYEMGTRYCSWNDSK